VVWTVEPHAAVVSKVAMTAGRSLRRIRYLQLAAADNAHRSVSIEPRVRAGPQLDGLDDAPSTINVQSMRY
jgi:hypothetical protein